MSVDSPNLDIPHLDANADSPEVVVNTAIDAFDAKITDAVTVAFGGNTVTLTQDQQALGSIFHLTTGSPGPTGACTLNFAAFGMGNFTVINGLSRNCTLQISGQSLPAPVLAAGADATFSCDGINVRAPGAVSGVDASAVTYESAVSPSLAYPTVAQALDALYVLVNGAGTGNVTGPGSSTDGHVVFFNGVSGKVIKDSGLNLSGSNTGDQTASTVHYTSAISPGPNSTNVGAALDEIYMLATIALSGGVTGPGSATDSHIALFNGSSGKAIKDSGALFTASAMPYVSAISPGPNHNTVAGALDEIYMIAIGAIRSDQNNTFTKSQRGTVQTLTPSSNIYTPNFDNGNNFTMTLSATNTLANPSTTPVAGQSGIIEIIQDGSGSRTLSWGSQYVAAGGVATLVLSTPAGAKDYASYYVVDSTHILVSLGALNASH